MHDLAVSAIIGGMKRGLAVVYTVVTVVFFLAVATVLLVRLGSVRDDNLGAAREQFGRLRQEISLNVQDTDLTLSRAVQAAFRDTGSRTVRIDAFAAYGFQDEGIEYLWARNRNMVEASAEEPPGFDYDRLSQVRLSGTVRLRNEDPLMVEGVYTVLERRDVFNLLRDALIAVLAFALIAVILAIVSLLRPSRAAPERPQAAPGPTPRRHAPAERPVSREQPAAAAPPSGTTAEAGLFSPVSGLSPEAHLEKRLTLELERAASNDQDLTICFVDYPGLTRGSETYRSVAGALLQFFGFEDLIFEYGKRSFCVLFPNVDLDEAIHTVEDFQRRGLEFQAASETEEQDGSAEATSGSDAQSTSAHAGGPREAIRVPEEPAFGLSSRNGRLVEGGRLMREARQALSKARETSGRIMAFRPDPQRYRKFITEKES